MTMDDQTAALLSDSLREMFTRRPADLSAALDELGWAEVAAEDPERATRLLFTEQGRSLTHSAQLDQVLLGGRADGRVIGYPVGSGYVLLSDPSTAREVLFLGDSRTGHPTVSVGAGDLRAESAAGFGVGSWYVATAPVGEVVAVEPDVDAGRRALAAEIIGICEAATALAVGYVTDRVQYGRPIGSFQAVRHRLSESHVAVNAARGVLDIACATGSSWDSALAKQRAGRAQAEITRNTIQVHGAIGLSAESVVQRYVTRAGSLDLLLGGHAQLSEQLGRDLLAGAELAPVAVI